MKRNIAAALLSVLILTAQAHGFQCEDGQAHVKLSYLGLEPNSQVEFYQVQILGKSKLQFDELSKVKDVDDLTMHLVTSAMKPVILNYYHKVDQNKCVEFGAGGEVDGPIAMRWPALAFDTKLPYICFSNAGTFSGRLTFALVTTEKHDPVQPRLENIQVFVQSRGGDGKDLVLFDTNTPCKE